MREKETAYDRATRRSLKALLVSDVNSAEKERHLRETHLVKMTKKCFSE